MCLKDEEADLKRVNRGNKYKIATCPVRSVCTSTDVGGKKISADEAAGIAEEFPTEEAPAEIPEEGKFLSSGLRKRSWQSTNVAVFDLFPCLSRQFRNGITLDLLTTVLGQRLV